MRTDLAVKMKPYWDDNPGKFAWPPRENYYEHYMTWSALVRPRSFLEIGVMYGWSAMAVLAGFAGIKRMVLIDSELYKIPVEEARRRVVAFCIDQGIPVLDITAMKFDTNTLTELPLAGMFDLVHVDGEHSEWAAYHDLCLVAPFASHCIIVDDLKLPGIKDGADRFLREHPEWEAQIHRDHQDHYVMWRK